MAFCSSCGNQLADEAKFCFNCGTKVALSSSIRTEQRKTIYDGEIHKCPNCGDILDAYESVCKACGYEQRGAQVVNSVRDLALELQKIEEMRPISKNESPIGKAFGLGQNAEIDQQQINLIRNFVIPNTKEDILEFAVLAASNVDLSSYDDSYGIFSTLQNRRRKAVSDAWLAKLKQAYQKAKLIFVGDPRISEIESLYDNTHKAIKKTKGRVWRILGITLGCCCAAFLLIGVIAIFSAENDIKEENARLEDIEVQLQEALQEEDYVLALMHADRLYFGENEEKYIRDWRIKREFWIKRIIEEAAEDGIALDPPPHAENTDG